MHDWDLVLINSRDLVVYNSKQSDKTNLLKEKLKSRLKREIRELFEILGILMK